MTLSDLSLLSLLALDHRRYYRTDYLAELMLERGFRVTVRDLRRLQKDGLVLKETQTNKTDKAEYWHISREGGKAMVEAMIELGWYEPTKG